ncbi:MAG: excisionase [Bacilli bacterium]|jgi:hypothetical protein|nr:excisionase [Bacilli bacterium]NMC61525.1 excisionase [Candidatus Methanofastidiosa archaeon]
MDINNFPDKNVSKKQLVTEYFPVFKLRTLDNYLTAIRKNDDFKNILISPTPRTTMINVRGFYLYLKYKESQKFKS